MEHVRRSVGRPPKYQSDEERSAVRREQKRLTMRLDNRRLRLEALEQFGGACVCCGETQPQFLSLDHPNGDGGKHRADMRCSGSTFLRKLRAAGWPAEYAIVVRCWNCHFAKDWYGSCPHQGAPDPSFIENAPERRERLRGYDGRFRAAARGR